MFFGAGSGGEELRKKNYNVGANWKLVIGCASFVGRCILQIAVYVRSSPSLVPMYVCIVHIFYMYDLYF